MPTYAYACSSCDHAFDVRQSFSDDPLTTCPRCERESLRKVFSPVGVVFKGSGFYRTDSRAAGRAKDGARAGGESGPAAGEKASPDSGGGTKTPDGTSAKRSTAPGAAASSIARPAASSSGEG